MKKFLLTILFCLIAIPAFCSTWYLDPQNGNDSTTATPYGWWSASVTVVTGSNPGASSTMTGGLSGATAITTIAPGSWSGTVTCYFYGMTGVFQSETVTFSNLATGTITGPLTYCAWQTLTNGATAARLTAGDQIRVSKSPAPVSLGNGTWTSTTNTGGGFPAAATVSGAVTSSGLIKLTVNQNIATGTVVQVLAVTGTIEANGVWIATNVDATHITLNGSTFVNAYVSGGTCQNITSKAVVLATAQTQMIAQADPAHGAWTVANSSTVTPTAYTTDGKSGNGSMLISKTSPANSTLYAYYATGTLNLSAYQNVSFWIKNSTAILANQWYLALCSDTAGAVVVNTIPIQAIPSTGQWVPLNVNTGGNLGASIKSVALYSGTSAATTAGIYLNDIIACTSTGLNLQSLISTNSAEQGGTEGWFGLQSIDPTGTILLIDNTTNTILNAGRGYYGTSQTATTYKRETFKTVLASAATTVINQMTKTGFITNGTPTYTDYEGGYNPATNLQTGESYFDGLNGWGYGLTATSVSYVQFNYLNAYRYYYNFYTSSVTYLSIPNLSNSGNGTEYNLYMASTYLINIGTIQNLNNGNNGYTPYPASNAITAKIQNVNSNLAYGLQIYEGATGNIGTVVNAANNGTGNYIFAQSGITIGSLTALYNGSVGLQNGGSISTINNLTTAYNGTYSLENTGGVLTIINGTFSEATLLLYENGANSSTFIENYQGANNSRYYGTDGGHSTGISGVWTNYITSSTRGTFYPMRLPIATIYGTANQPVSVTGTLQASNSGIIGAIICPGGQIAGVPSDVIAQTSGVSSQTLTITFTPTASGPVTIYFQSWEPIYGAGYSVTLQNIFTNSRVYGYVSQENTEGTLDFGQNYILKYTAPVSNPYITQTNQATVAAYTDFTFNQGTNTLTLNSNSTTARMYDWMQWYVQQNNIPTNYTTADGSNFVSSFNINLAGFALTGGTSINVGTNTFTFGGGTYTGNVITSTNTIVNIDVNNLVAGSRVYVYDTTTSTSLYNAIVSGTSVAIPFTWTTNNAINFYVKYTSGLTAYLMYTASGTVTNTGLSINANQIADTTYAANNLDGSTVTTCSISGTNMYIYVDDPTNNQITMQSIYNWYQYILSTSVGIADQSGSYVIAQSPVNYTVAVGFQFINSDTVHPLTILGANIAPVSGTGSLINTTNGASTVIEPYYATNSDYSVKAVDVDVKNTQAMVN